MFSLFKVPDTDQTPVLTLVSSLPQSAAADASGHASADAPTQRRTPPQPQDRTLSAEARQWLRRLPSRDRPLALCALYARLANRLAAAWDDPLHTEALFDELLIDHRGGLSGFPPLVAAELMRLHRLHEARLEERSGG